MMHSVDRSLAGIPIAFAVLLALFPGSAQAEDDTLALGKSVFLELAEPQCALCHTLADAGSSGDIGPDLDQLQPTEERVRAAVTQGIDVMPSYAELLSEEQLDAVAHYVATVAGQD